jgi:hypothetical protein
MVPSSLHSSLRGIAQVAAEKGICNQLHDRIQEMEYGDSGVTHWPPLCVIAEHLLKSGWLIPAAVGDETDYTSRTTQLFRLGTLPATALVLSRADGQYFALGCSVLKIKANSPIVQRPEAASKRPWDCPGHLTSV